MNRVLDTVGDQTVKTGHENRPEDLDRFAALGITALRYPVLWERIAPDHPDILDWSWTDARLERLRALGIRPIAGLVHHGSGPKYTDLLDPGFATGLARFALAAAQRYDWVRDWTPVNEPLTTARFSALYGHWYPHHRDERSFWLALLNQVEGVRLSMRAIRTVRPDARLIQTDDLGRTWATVPLRQQAAFNNSRRWMGWDLLCGRVTPGHAMWERLVGHGFRDQLRSFADDPCPPDVIGVNHYLTSDRFLDHRMQRYPAWAAGGDQEARYADVPAVRVLDPAPSGLRGALEEAWARYRIPLAVTEVHNGCTREEQMRWMADAWHAASELRAGGMEVEAVTSWALLGNDGWDKLLTSPGRYEAGAFDVRGEVPRLTGLGALLPKLARGDCDHPVLGGGGWWRRPVRFVHRPTQRAARMKDMVTAPNRATAFPVAPILICGATGTLGQAVARACRHRELAFVLTSRSELDLDSSASVAAALDRHRPWAVINAAGWVRVDDAEDAEDACMAANSEAAARLADACAARGIPTVQFSSDLVFDGAKGAPYTELDPVAPLNAYGRSKADAENRIAALPGEHLIIRTAAFFSPFDPHNFAARFVAAASASSAFEASDAHIVSPTYVPHLCNAVLDLLIDGATGIWHLTNETALSWHGFAEAVAERCGLDAGLARAVASLPGERAARPASAPLASARGSLLPPLREALDEFAAHVGAAAPVR
ncbi:sugar nucleotide-binding protein [Sphingomonas sp.]|uniref:sugar nucleotide-binding protein n=1 Tax=Sphingomonas sp. TaxID=28214 RepID=UPI002ED9E14B